MKLFQWNEKYLSQESNSGLLASIANALPIEPGPQLSQSKLLRWPLQQ